MLQAPLGRQGVCDDDECSNSNEVFSSSMSRIPSSESSDSFDGNDVCIGQSNLVKDDSYYTGTSDLDVDETSHHSPSFLSPHSSFLSLVVGQEYEDENDDDAFADDYDFDHDADEFPEETSSGLIRNVSSALVSTNANDDQDHHLSPPSSPTYRYTTDWQTADEYGDDEDEFNSDEEDYESDFSNDSLDSIGPLHSGHDVHAPFHFEALSTPSLPSASASTPSSTPEQVQAMTSLRPRPRVDSIDYIVKKYPRLARDGGDIHNKTSVHNGPGTISDAHTRKDPNTSSNLSDQCPSSPRLQNFLTLQPDSPSIQYINQKSEQARRALKSKSQQAHQALKQKSNQARNALHKSNVKMKQIRTAYRKKRETRSRIIVIPANHRLKNLWDCSTIVLTFVSAYYTHIYIRDRSTYDWDEFVLFSNVWYFIDICLNFCTEHRTSDGKVMRSGREVWGRYLTTWFAIDALSLLPWERMFLRPIIQAQKKRHFVVKWFFRSKAVVKVSRILKHRHFRAFGMVANNTKKIGVGGKRLLQLIIKYLPKYILFYRNMKAVLVLKTLRLIHFSRKIFKNATSNHEDEEDDEYEVDPTMYEADDDSLYLNYGSSKDDDNDVDTLSCTTSDESNNETDYESCLDDSMDFDYNVRLNIPGLRRRPQVLLQILDDDNIVDEY